MSKLPITFSGAAADRGVMSVPALAGSVCHLGSKLPENAPAPGNDFDF